MLPCQLLLIGFCGFLFNIPLAGPFMLENFKSETTTHSIFRDSGRGEL